MSNLNEGLTLAVIVVGGYLLFNLLAEAKKLGEVAKQVIGTSVDAGEQLKNGFISVQTIGTVEGARRVMENYNASDPYLSGTDKIALQAAGSALNAAVNPGLLFDVVGNVVTNQVNTEGLGRDPIGGGIITIVDDIKNLFGNGSLLNPFSGSGIRKMNY